MASSRQFKQTIVNFAFSALLASILPSSFAGESSEKLTSDEITKTKATLEVIQSKLTKASKSKTQIQVLDSDEVRIQTSDNGKGIITITTGLVLRFNDDRDAVASLIAQQQALFNQKPEPRAEQKKNPTTSRLMDLVGSAVSNAVDSKVGISGASQTIAEGGSEIANSLISRAREKEADESTISWMIESGYNPYGALRAQKVMLALVDAGQAQSKVDPGERIAYLEALIQDNSKSKNFTPTDKIALVNRPQAAASTTSSTNSSNESTGAVDEPIDGVSLSQYAAIKNDIAFKGNIEGLAKHNLSPDAFTKIDQQWTSRIAQDKKLNLAVRYSTHYMEASQGEFADWGRDVAQIKQTGRLQLGTDPTSVDDWIFLYKANKEVALGGPDGVAAFNKAAKDKGLSAYDFQIVNAWWTQRAKDKASQGDKSLLQRMN